MADFAFAQLLFRPIEYLDFKVVFPISCVERVEQVKIDVVCLKPFELAVEITVKILLRFDQPGGHFCCQVYLFTVAILQHASNKGLALLRVIGPGGIHIVQALIDRPAQHCGSKRFVDPGVVAIDDRQTHAAKAQRGNFQIQLSKFSIFHLSSISNVI